MKHRHQPFSEPELTFWIMMMVLFAAIVWAGYLCWKKAALYGP
jgi:tryptophan-rich sensory protein